MRRQGRDAMSSRGKGILAIVLSAFGFALMALFVRLCDDYGAPIPSVQKSFFRNAVALAIAAFAWWRARAARGGRRPPPPAPGGCRLASFGLLLLRSALGTVGIFANFYALSHIPIAEGQTLNKTAPFFTVVFAWLFFRERAGRRHLLPLLLAFLGVVLVAKPGFAGAAAFPLAMGLLGGVCAGGAYACVRGLRRQGVDPVLIVLFFSAFSCLASVPFLAAGLTPMTGTQLMILFGAGAGAAIGQFGITLAYGYAPPREIAVYDYSNILFTAALGYLVFDQMPDALSVAGFAVLLVAAFRMFRSDPANPVGLRTSRQPPPCDGASGKDQAERQW